ncbi:MAG: hypothetical protein V3V49_01610 [Candidatus Krumholzibacteria bacterium]
MRTAFVTVGFTLLLAALNLAPASAGPPSSKAAKKLILETADAHGGLAKWRSAPTISFTHTMVSPAEPDDPWVSIETIDQKTRREYQDWPLDKSSISWDGHEAWSVDWKRGNPPKFMVNQAYYVLNLPWIASGPDVHLDDPTTGTIPGSDKEYTAIRVTFAPTTVKSPDDYFVLYIDPDTRLMKAIEYNVTYGAMLDAMGLPAEMKSMGPLFHVFDAFRDVEGLKMPASYRTFSPAGDMYGEHEVSDWSLRKTFDESRMTMPEGAVRDTSSAKRKT